MPTDISIIVPVYNEAGNVLRLAEEVAAALDGGGKSYELVFVDDGSTDETWSNIRKAQRRDARVRGIRHLQNGGQSAALWTGIQGSSSPIVATLDGDLQNDPCDLPKMIAELKQCDFVCGIRAKRQDNWVRRVSSKVARIARKLALGVDFADTGCALRVFRREALTGVFPFNGIHRFLPILVHGGGHIVREVPIHHRPRVAGVSKYGVWNRLGRGIFDLAALAWYQRRRLRQLPCADPEIDPQTGSDMTSDAQASKLQVQPEHQSFS